MTLEVLLAVGIGLLGGCGTWLVLRARTFPVVLGFTLLSYAVNLFVFAAGGIKRGAPAIVGAVPVDAMADPLPQALVLTAIVIGFGMTAFLVVLALRLRGETGSDHVDATPPHGPSA
jgi:multisubunit Na+/H+ antiporter MnhC subunit